MESSSLLYAISAFVSMALTLLLLGRVQKDQKEIRKNHKEMRKEFNDLLDGLSQALEEDRKLAEDKRKGGNEES